MAARVSIPAWHDLGPTEQALLAAAAELGDDAFPSEIVARLDIATRDLARAEERLADSGYLRQTVDGAVALTDLMPATVVMRMSAAAARYGAGEQRATARTPDARPRPTERVPPVHATRQGLLRAARRARRRMPLPQPATLRTHTPPPSPPTTHQRQGAGSPT